MIPSPSVSVVITTYNRSDALVAVLDALTRQTNSNFDVVVADDGSTAAHQQAIHNSTAAKALRATHVWHPDVGFTASRVRNRGVKAARGDYIILLDGDCVPERDFIAQHMRLAQEGCFINGSRVLLSPVLTQQVVNGAVQIDGCSKSYWLDARLHGDASKLGHLLRLPDWNLRKKPTFYWKGIRSANMAVWRKDFETIDGFDESYVGWGHEDADFVLRLHNAGLVRKNGFCATEVFHLWHKEASRNKESHNAALITARAEASSKPTRAVLGYSQVRVKDGAGDDVIISKL
jgi:GT2 family glycosyltransferase